MSRRRTTTNSAVPNPADNPNEAPATAGGKRSRRDGKDPNDMSLAASLEFRSVNNTLQAFTGGRQKSWMLNSNAMTVPTNGSTQTVIRAQTGPLKIRKRPKIAAASEDDKELHNGNVPTLANLGPGMSPPTAENSTSPEMRNRGLPPSRNVETQSSRATVINIFPSPAPSESPPRTDHQTDHPEVQHDDIEARVTNGRPRRSIITPGESVQEASEAGNDQMDPDMTEDGEHDQPSTKPLDVAAQSTSKDLGADNVADGLELSGERTVQKRPRSTTSDDNPRPEKRIFSWPQTTESSLPSIPSSEHIGQADRSGSLPSVQNTAHIVPIPPDARSSPSDASHVPVTENSFFATRHQSVDSRFILTSNSPTEGPAPEQFHRRASDSMYQLRSQQQSIPYSNESQSPTRNIGSPLGFPPQVGSPVYAYQQRSTPSQQMSPLNPQSANQPQPFSQSPPPQQQQAALILQQQFQNQQRAENRMQVDNRVQILLKALNQFKAQEQHNGFNEVEVLRLRLLEYAIVSDDWFFLLLHQVYVNSAINHAPLTPLGITMQHAPGFQALKPILEDNTRLSLRCLNWFAEFPASLTSPLIRQPMCQSTLARILKFLAEGYKNLLHMQSIALTRMVVFTARDVARYLGLKSSTLETQISSVLQDSIFKLRTGGGINMPTYNTQSPPAPTNNFQQFPTQLTPQHSPQMQSVEGSYNGYFDPSHAQRTTAGSPPVSLQFQTGPCMVGRTTAQRNINGSMPSQRSMTRADTLSRAGASVGASRDPPPASSNGRRSIDASAMVVPGHSPMHSPMHSFLPAPGSEYAWMNGGPRMPPATAGSSPQFNNQPQLPPQPPAYVRQPLQARRGRERPLPPVGPVMRNPAYTGSLAAPSGTAPASASYLHGGYPQPPTLSLPSMPTAGPVIPENILQAHLASPTITSPPPQGPKPPKVFLSIVDFAVRRLLLSSSCERRTWTVDENTMSMLSKTTPPANRGESSKRSMVVPGNLIYRLRCAEVPRGERIPETDAEWIVKDHVWPKNTFVEVNKKRIEFRRKAQWGKDQCADITNFLRCGENELKVVQLCGNSEQKGSTYVMAVEIFECRDEDTLKANLDMQRIDSATAKEMILSRLTRNNDSDDLIVSSSNVVLSVVCPMSFLFPTLPVRGRSCRHLECFDYYNYINSRPKKRDWEPPLLDSYRCPLCKGDARPSELIIDGFMLDVLEKLRLTDDPSDIKDIIVHSDGHWEVKPEKDMEKEQTRAGRNEGSEMKQLKKEVEVICLEDDD